MRHFFLTFNIWMTISQSKGKRKRFTKRIVFPIRNSFTLSDTQNKNLGKRKNNQFKWMGYLSSIINCGRYDIWVSTIWHLFLCSVHNLMRTYHATITYPLKTLHVKTKPSNYHPTTMISNTFFDSHRTIEKKYVRI